MLTEVGRALRWQSVALMVPLVFLAVFFFYPLFEILRISLAPDGQLDLTPVAALVRESYYGRVLWFTTWQATVSTILTLAVGLPAAYVFARYTFPGKTVLRALSTVPFVMPTVVVAAAFSALLGPNGEVNRWLMQAFHLSQPPCRFSKRFG